MNKLNDDSESEFANIRNQIIKQFFAEFDPKKLPKILEIVGCKTSDCPALIDISSIDYMIDKGIIQHVKRLTSIGERRNKKVTESLSTTLINNSTSKIEASTEPKQLNVVQNFEVNIRKTGRMWCDAPKEISFTAASNLIFNFTKNWLEDVGTSNLSQPFVLHAFPQSVTLNPMTKMNVTYNFYQYEQSIEYSFDFELFKSSTIKHPNVGGNGNVVFTTSSLLDFLQKHLELVKNLKYASSTSIRLESIAENRFTLRNFPATEKITNFGVELIYGKPEPITPPEEY